MKSEQKLRAAIDKAKALKHGDVRAALRQLEDMLAATKTQTLLTDSNNIALREYYQSIYTNCTHLMTVELGMMSRHLFATLNDLGNFEKADNNQTILNAFNSLSALIIRELLNITDINKRTITLERYIRIMFECFKFGDFFSAKVIYTTIAATDIDKLHKTKKGLSEHAKNILKVVSPHFFKAESTLTAMNSRKPGTYVPDYSAIRTKLVALKEKAKAEGYGSDELNELFNAIIIRHKILIEEPLAASIFNSIDEIEKSLNSSPRLSEKRRSHLLSAKQLLITLANAKEKNKPELLVLANSLAQLLDVVSAEQALDKIKSDTRLTSLQNAMLITPSITNAESLALLAQCEPKDKKIHSCKIFRGELASIIIPSNMVNANEANGSPATQNALERMNSEAMVRSLEKKIESRKHELSQEINKRHGEIIEHLSTYKESDAVFINCSKMLNDINRHIAIFNEDVTQIAGLLKCIKDASKDNSIISTLNRVTNVVKTTKIIILLENLLEIYSDTKLNDLIKVLIEWRTKAGILVHSKLSLSTSSHQLTLTSSASSASTGSFISRSGASLSDTLDSRSKSVSHRTEAVTTVEKEIFPPILKPLDLTTTIIEEVLPSPSDSTKKSEHNSPVESPKESSSHISPTSSSDLRRSRHRSVSKQEQEQLNNSAKERREKRKSVDLSNNKIRVKRESDSVTDAVSLSSSSAHVSAKKEMNSSGHHATKSISSARVSRTDISSHVKTSSIDLKEDKKVLPEQPAAPESGSRLPRPHHAIRMRSEYVAPNPEQKSSLHSVGIVENRSNGRSASISQAVPEDSKSVSASSSMLEFKQNFAAKLEAHKQLIAQATPTPSPRLRSGSHTPRLGSGRDTVESSSTRSSPKAETAIITPRALTTTHTTTLGSPHPQLGSTRGSTEKTAMNSSPRLGGGSHISYFGPVRGSLEKTPSNASPKATTGSHLGYAGAIRAPIEKSPSHSSPRSFNKPASYTEGSRQNSSRDLRLFLPANSAASGTTRPRNNSLSNRDHVVPEPARRSGGGSWVNRDGSNVMQTQHLSLRRPLVLGEIHHKNKATPIADTEATKEKSATEQRTSIPGKTK